MKYLYTLLITEKESGNFVGTIEEYSLESLEENLSKVPAMIEEYENGEIDPENIFDDDDEDLGKDEENCGAVDVEEVEFKV